MNRFKIIKKRTVTAYVYGESFQIPINNSYRRLFDKIPKFEVLVDLRGRLHLVSVEPVKNAKSYFEPLEGIQVDVNEK